MNARRAVARLRKLAGLPARAAPRVGTTPADTIHRENKWRLLRYRPRAEGLAYRTPVLLVPSLINRYYVLDLQPGRSFAEYLVGRGHDVSIIDWGTPGPEDRYLELDEFCDRYLRRAIARSAAAAGSRQVHVLGYCLGGTMAAIHTALRPERVASLVALAAPIRFSEAGILADWTRSPGFDVDALVDAFGNVPWPLMQASFHLMRPTLPLAKLATLVDRAWDDHFLDGFFATERWGNDNVSLPGNAFRRTIRELYRGDALAGGTLEMSGRRVDLGAIRCPTLAVTFAHDHIVPSASAAALLDCVGAADTELLQLSGGHVGAVVSRRAAEGLWPTLSRFWAERDQPPYRREPPARGMRTEAPVMRSSAEAP